jgi:predicted metal-dependent phosphoesterase TrpH
MRKMAPGVPEILAEETMTAEGEIIGVFLSHIIPPYVYVAEIIDIIHEQGGLALVPRPFCSFRTSSALWRDTFVELVGDVDIIEGFSARSLREEDN